MALRRVALGALAAAGIAVGVTSLAVARREPAYALASESAARQTAELVVIVATPWPPTPWP